VSYFDPKKPDPMTDIWYSLHNLKLYNMTFSYEGQTENHLFNCSLVYGFGKYGDYAQVIIRLWFFPISSYGRDLNIYRCIFL
jgi:hypothetical protein